MNSEDIRNSDDMKKVWNQDTRHSRLVNIVFVGGIAVIAAIFIAGCPHRWPIIIKGGGHGGGEDQTVEGGK